MKRSEILISFGAIVFWLTAVAGGYAIGSDIKNARRIVLRDTMERMQFEAELMGKVNPDFLKELTKGK